MSIDAGFQGSLFANDFLRETVAGTAEWQALDDARLDEIEAALRTIFERFPFDGSPNESQTEDDLIWPVLGTLRWTASLRQQNLSTAGRGNVPDGLLFADEAAKGQANRFGQEWKRYDFGLAVVESKRWQRPLDRRSGRADEATAPSTQMLRYLRRVDDLTSGTLRWGILTNGAAWRLYYQGARSVSEQFFEADVPAILDLPGHDEGLFRLSPEERRHCLKVFVLVFGRDSFLPDAADGRTFHQRAIEEGRFYEERVAGNLSELVFVRVFPELARVIAAAAPDAPLSEVREAALILLYRLLFILYAEDRDLLPVRDKRYDDYALRDRVRGDVGRRKDLGDTFAETLTTYWSAIDDLCRAVDGGEVSIGLPPYNGGLFDPSRTPLLGRVRLGDRVMADVIDALSFEQGEAGRRYINYRDLGVRQLGSIYERLLEHEVVREGDGVAVRPNIFARKGSGSYYTPDDLVGLIVEETIGPLTKARMDAFEAEAARVPGDGHERERTLARLAEYDPAEAILTLRVCDPAMGSGHFLVSLVDWLADRVIAAMAEAEAEVEGYVSPLAERIQAIRETIAANAAERNWAIDLDRLDDRHIVRRMVLKRCVYGVDKNPMAVELAKVALWLHTFTVGAPLSFLDHHLRCGDSLFGAWARSGIDKATEYGSPLLLHASVTTAETAARSMRLIEGLTDAEIAEAQRSADTFAEVERATGPLNAVLSLVHAFDWLNIRDREGKAALQAFFTGQLGDPIAIAVGEATPKRPKRKSEPGGLEKQISPEESFEAYSNIADRAKALIENERFFHWQTAFPEVWTNWQEESPEGGFDAVIGNPPWDRIKLQQVEWFATRRREIALQPRAADRRRMIAVLEEADDPLARDYALANERATMAARMARHGGDYPLLSSGDVNLYSLFVERAMALVKPDGVVGLLTPSGIASDKTASRFFKGVATEGRLKALYDFENRKVFFPDVHASFKFCAFVAGRSPLPGSARCGFFLQDIAEIDDPERCFPLTAEAFARVNPNTGTAPIFRTSRDAALTTAIYERLPVLVDRSSGEEVKAWPVKYTRMFDMTNDSGLFRTRAELEEREGAYPIGGNRFASPEGEWVPLYVGRMIHMFDHRAASVEVNAENLHNVALSGDISAEQKADPAFVPTPQYWVRAADVPFQAHDWTVAFRDIARATDVRTMIAAAVPFVGLGNTAPAIFVESSEDDRSSAAMLLANFGATVFDFVVRQKAQSTHLNWFIVEQLPVVPPDRYEAVRFGPKTVGEVVRQAVLELTYTANDMAPFARDMGHIDGDGSVLPPFQWDKDRCLFLRAKLDAVFFHLYGVTDRDDVRHVYSSFPIVERQETAAYGTYRTREVCLAWMNALVAGDPDAEIDLQ